MSQAKYRPTDKTLLVTHKGCLDGTGSALMFLWRGGKRENILFRNPSGCGLTPAELPVGVDEVWFADLCPPVLEGAGGGLPFHVFDHHLSNQKKFGDDPRCTFSMDHSGTSLMARDLGIIDDLEEHRRHYLSQGVDVDDLIEALEAYDLGRFDFYPGQRLADIAATYTQEQMLEIMSLRDVEEVLFDRDLTQRAEAMAAVRNLYAEAAARSARRTTLCEGQHGGIPRDILVGVAVSPVYWKNAVSQALLHGPDPVEMAAVIDTTTQMISLRSLEGGPDCSAIAVLYGGGGHARAAGFKANGQRLLSVLFQEVFG